MTGNVILPPLLSPAPLPQPMPRRRAEAGPVDRVEVGSPAPVPPTAPPTPEPERPKQLPHPADAIVSTQPLGPLYTPQQTTFRVWAPTASKLQLRVYDAPVGGTPRLLEMKKNAADGTWETTLQGDCKGVYYTLSAAGDDPGFHPDRELVDPYATCVTAFDGRAMVADDRTRVTPRPPLAPQDAVIYEMHLRDFTVDPDSGVQRRGRYLGLTEAGTHLAGRPDVATGLDHIADLGVNTVQIMPITEFASDEANDKYGWGYDAILYNTPDGWYASERLDDSRVRETKQMIDALHRRGMRVIMDVVFNHTIEDIESVNKRAVSFEGLVPGYFYRRHLDGTYWNGSACGNEIRTEAPMARRFIKDSVKRWVSEYGVDGFRFDLMGLIDQQTMKEIAAELHATDPSLLVYGEPWAAGDTPIDITAKGKQRGLGFGVFNDTFRDALKGSVFQARDRGFVQDGSHRDEVRKGVQGSVTDFADSPLESLNYVECHDNLTLWDKLQVSTLDDPSVTDADRRAMDKLAATVVMTSFGVPFLQSGQEMLRSKGGDDNSYDRPDSVNMLRWGQKVANNDVFGYYKGLIALRKAHPLFRPATAADARAALKFFDTDLGIQMADRTLGYVIADTSGKDSWARAAVLLNADKQPRDVPLPAGKWQVYVDGMRVADGATAASATVRVPAHSALVLGELKGAGGTTAPTPGP